MSRDSGYESLDDESIEIIEYVNEELLAYFRSPSLMSAEENKEMDADEKVNDDYEDFQEWLKKVADCLEGRKKGDPEKIMGQIVQEHLTEEERCMKVARYVLDEEAVLDMVKTFLQYTRVMIINLCTLIISSTFLRINLCHLLQR